MPRGPKPKSHCKNGHEIATVGRYANGVCVACSKGRNRGRDPRYCRRGHDTTLTGRFANGVCRECDHIHAAAHRLRQGRKAIPFMSRVFLPSEPLMAYVLSDRLTQVQRNTLRKAHSRGKVTASLADELCCALGMHPAEVYGYEWFEASV